jgi:hypothetical protein
MVLIDLWGYPQAGLLGSTTVGAVLCLLARWRGWILSDHVAWRRFLSRRRKEK